MKTYKLNGQDRELIEKAKEIVIKSKPVNLIDTGDVGAALVTRKGNIFQGVSMGFYCGIGSCGEYQAIGAMISNGEKEIKTIVAVYYSNRRKKYKVVPPCGKCREMIQQASKKNQNTEVIVSENKKIKLKDLIPYSWGGDNRKMKIRFCPKCRSTDIVAVAGMQIGLFECVRCGFRSPIFPEKELEEVKAK